MLVEKLRDMYQDVENILQVSDIKIISDFKGNWESILAFNRKYYADGEPKTVLCGLNPGRLGAGKTGVPFIDFKSLSAMIKGVDRNDSERSAQFFYEIVSHFGAEEFYRSFYVTNISWLGYTKRGKNLNFDSLPSNVEEMVLDRFTKEMGYVKPSKVIGMGGAAQQAAKQVLPDLVNTIGYLPHPNYCAFPSRREKYKQLYIQTLEPFIVTD